MFRFSIRDLLWLMVVVGLIVGWRVHSEAVKTAYKQRELLATSHSARIAALMADLGSNDWETVLEAKEQLESSQELAIPALLRMLDCHRVEKLKNTADLIYPGAERSYGHGWVVNYDLDFLPARAGWVLEEITFCDFGFMSILPANRAEQLPATSSAARAWWSNHREGWSRYSALREALLCSNSLTQMRGLNWLRFGETNCRELSLDKYNEELLPIVKLLSQSASNGVGSQADLQTYYFKIAMRIGGNARSARPWR